MVISVFHLLTAPPSQRVARVLQSRMALASDGLTNPSSLAGQLRRHLGPGSSGLCAIGGEDALAQRRGGMNLATVSVALLGVEVHVCMRGEGCRAHAAPFRSQMSQVQSCTGPQLRSCRPAGAKGEKERGMASFSSSKAHHADFAHTNSCAIALTHISCAGSLTRLASWRRRAAQQPRLSMTCLASL